MNNRKFLLFGIILLGFALRLFHLNTVSLRGDEAFTVLHWMREPLATTIAEIATKDPQAPLSYALYRGWALTVGMSESVARFLPALFSVLGIPAMYALGRRMRGARFGLLAAFLWAIHPYQIWHAQDARSYAIWSALSLLAVWLALRAIDKQRRVDWLLYIAAAVLAGYIYYLELFVLVVLNLYVLLTRWRERQVLLRWFGSQAIIGLLLALWYIQPRLLTGSGYGGTAGGFAPNEWITKFLPTLTLGADARMFGDTYSALIILLVLALIAGLALWWRINRQQALLVGLWGVVPPLLLGIVALRLNVFEPRYVLAAAPAYTLLLCALVFGIKAKIVRVALASLVSFTSVFILFNYYFVTDYAKVSDWRALASFLSEVVSPGDWVTQAGADIAFALYCEDYKIAEICDDQLPANPDQSAEEIRSLLTTRSEASESLWYVGMPQAWANANVAQNWLDGHMQRVRETTVDGMLVQQFKRWEVKPNEYNPMPLATFEDLAELVGAETSNEPDGTITVRLYWRALSRSETRLKVFLHLSTDDGQIAAQDDQYPQDGRADTTTWQAGTIYRDVYTLPPAPLGAYSLLVGWYEPETNRRLLVDGDGDSFAIKTLEID